jgi:Zn finger protein HypA/HybF involved in hydrogenase expression
MGKDITVPLLKVEDFAAADLRRNNYAMKRDLQNSEFNEAILTRLHAAENIKIKCDKCGKEFPKDASELSATCPDCRG